MKTSYLSLIIPILTILDRARGQALIRRQAFLTTVVVDDPDTGELETVVEQIQTNLNGVPVASVILTTLDPGGSTPPPTLTPAPPTGTGAAASATTPNFIQGQPNQNNGPAPPTTYVYTTIDAAGNTLVFTAVFTPTFQPTSPNPKPSKGTIIAYSDYTANFSPIPSQLLHKNAAASWRLGLGITMALGATILSAMWTLLRI